MNIVRFSEPEGSVAVGAFSDDSPDSIQRFDNVESTNVLTRILEADDPAEFTKSLLANSTSIPLESITFLPPIEDQEVWAAGVTYKRSKTARMEESELSASCYDRVYESPRPELFLKATPNRCVGHRGSLRIRRDSKWNVPEPELTLVLNSQRQLVGFTIGNDMSSRDIEGENPLYLPQAKVYNQCCGLGPWIRLASEISNPENLEIGLKILRGGETVFSGETSTSQLARSFEDLIQWLTRDNDFPSGCMLLTGTGIVPPSDFTLKAGDEVLISIEQIGTLTNTIVQS